MTLSKSSPQTTKRNKKRPYSSWLGFCSVFAWVWFVGLPHTHAQDKAPPNKTAQWLKQARQQLAQGKMSLTEAALQNAEQSLIHESKTWDPQKTDNYRLWLWLLWFKFFQLQGQLPPFVSFEAFEKKSQVQEQITHAENALTNLRQAVGFLEQYNQLYRRVVQRAKVSEALSYLSTKSRQGRMENTIQIAELRVARLKQILRNWKKTNAKDRKSQLNALEKKLSTQSQKLQQLQQEQKNASQRIAKQTQAIQEAQAISLRMEQSLTAQEQNSRILRWIGIGAAALGAVTTIVGIVLYQRAYAKDDNGFLVAGKDLPAFKNGGLGSIIGGSGLIALGGGLFLVGHLTKPSQKQRYEGVYRSHKHYIDWEKTTFQRKTIPRTTPPPHRVSLPPSLNSTTAKTIVLFP